MLTQHVPGVLTRKLLLTSHCKASSYIEVVPKVKTAVQDGKPSTELIHLDTRDLEGKPVCAWAATSQDTANDTMYTSISFFTKTTIIILYSYHYTYYYTCILSI